MSPADWLNWFPVGGGGLTLVKRPPAATFWACPRATTMRTRAAQGFCDPCASAWQGGWWVTRWRDGESCLLYLVRCKGSGGSGLS